VAPEALLDDGRQIGIIGAENESEVSKRQDLSARRGLKKVI
jgi:hypothetical protein